MTSNLGFCIPTNVQCRGKYKRKGEGKGVESSQAAVHIFGSHSSVWISE